MQDAMAGCPSRVPWGSAGWEQRREPGEGQGDFLEVTPKLSGTRRKGIASLKEGRKEPRRNGVKTGPGQAEVLRKKVKA